MPFDVPEGTCPNGAVRSRLPVAVALCLSGLSGLSACLSAGCGQPGADVRASPLPSAPPPPSASSAAAAPATAEIVVIGTSDLHGRIAALPLLGGYVGAVRDRAPGAVVLVDAGDMFQGTLESNMGEGQAVIAAYATLGYDAAAIGNHEFDYGPIGDAGTVRKDAPAGPDRDARGALKARAAQAKGAFLLLAANLLEDDLPITWPNVTPSVIVKKAGVDVGIIGVTTMSTTKTTIAANVVGIRTIPLADAIATEAKALRSKGAKLIVVAAHAGGECKSLDAPTDLSTCDASAEIFDVARALPAGTVNAIVAGHTHKAVAHEVAGIPIVQSNAYGTHFGRVDITVEVATGKVVRAHIHSPEPVRAGSMFEGLTMAPSPDVEKAVNPWIDRAKARRDEPLGAVLDGPFLAKYREESPLGNLVASALLDLDPGADLAFANGGGLRADLPAGPLTYGALYDALPFDNRLARLTMTGRALRDMLARNLSGKGGILSLAGARVVARCERGKLDVELTLTPRKGASRKVKDTDRLRIVTNEFLATRGDDFGPGEDVEIDESGPPFRDPIAALLKKRGGKLRPDEWLVPGKPRIALPGPLGEALCSGK